MESGMTAIYIILAIVIILAAWYHFTDTTEYEFICPNCGTKKKTFYQSDATKCSSCSHSQLVPTATPRGRELNELYHGSTAIEQRLRTAHEAAKTLVERLEGAVPATAVADEWEKLARLVQEGALSPEEWQRAKNLILGQPKDKQADAIERVAKLYRAYQTGALSQSEFNMTKWDILSRVGRV
jgi:DNA-directed RNA polymerase subunit RPC12/RpoP